MDEDYVAGRCFDYYYLSFELFKVEIKFLGFSPFVRRDVDSKSALLRAKAGGSSMRQWMKNYDYQNTQRKQKK